MKIYRLDKAVQKLDTPGLAYCLGYLANRIRRDDILYHRDFVEAICEARRHQRKVEKKNGS